MSCANISLGCICGISFLSVCWVSTKGQEIFAKKMRTQVLDSHFGLHHLLPVGFHRVEELVGQPLELDEREGLLVGLGVEVANDCATGDNTGSEAVATSIAINVGGDVHRSMGDLLDLLHDVLSLVG